MNRLLGSFFICVLIQTIANGLSFNECSTEEEAIAWLRSKIEDNEKIDKNIISIAVQRSWWNAAEHIVTTAQEQGVDISSPFSRSAAIIKSNLQKIQNMINANKNDWSVISPAFQWAQGMNDVHINVKYAHKWDTPATLGCSVHNITFFEKSVYVESKCPSTKKKFVLNLALRKELNPEECHWSDASVGRVVVMMKKKERGHWENIVEKGFKAPRNMHTWWSMKEQLEKEDETTRKNEEKVREEEEKKKREEERKKEEEKKKEEEQQKAAEEEKKTREAIKEASKAAEKAREEKQSSESVSKADQSSKNTLKTDQSSESISTTNEENVTVEVQSDGSVH